VTRPLPDRLRDRLLLAMIAFRRRAEVADAVRHGRAVDDPELAGQAVERARRWQDPRFWKLRRPVLLLIAAGWFSYTLAFREWAIVPLALLYLVLAFNFKPSLIRGKAQEAEEANRRLQETSHP
jgi:hypothetical protein